MEQPYWQRVVIRAFGDTLSFFGWNRRTLALPALYIAGAAVHWGIAGWDAVVSEVLATLAYGLVPVGGFAVLLFVWNWIKAPGRIQRETEEQNVELADKLNKIKNKQDKVDALSNLLDEAIHKIWNRPVTNNNELNELDKYWHEWMERVEGFLRENFTHSDLIHFSRLGVVPLVGRSDTFEDGTGRHAKILREYALKEQRLREIIRDHNVTHI